MATISSQGEVKILAAFLGSAKGVAAIRPERVMVLLTNTVR